jgi:hypothetical protein
MALLSEADALAIHDAIHSKAKQVTLSTGIVLPIFISQNGCRRCDLPTGAFSKNAKLMAQNLQKSSGAAARARAGAKITHIIPVGANGQHVSSTSWGIIEGDKVTRSCFAVENPNAPPEDPARTKYGHLRRECTFLHCPFTEKEEAKGLGACWDGLGEGCRRQWYVPPGLPLARFARWMPTAAPTAEEAADDGVEVAGMRTWAERDAELRKRAVPLDEDDEAGPTKRAKQEPPSPPTAVATRAEDAPSSLSSTSSATPGPSKGSLKEKADQLGAALGLAPDAPLPEVARAACEATDVDTIGKSLAAQIAASYDVIFGAAV